MECPKCGGGCLLSEEELVKIIEGKARDAVKAVVRATYICRACAEKFSRLFVDDLSKRQRPPEIRPSQYSSTPEPVSTTSEGNDPADSLKFF